jgi:hypothetical protein
MLINTCCGYESRIAYDLCPDCQEHCDWEDLDEEEEEPTQEEKQLDADTERAIEEEQINNQNK